jgi:hypothetical protein
VIEMRPKLVEDVIRGELTDDEVVVSLRGGERALILNALGDALLDLCDGSRTVDEIAAFVRETMSVPATIDVSSDIESVIGELVRAGVVEALE